MATLAEQIEIGTELTERLAEDARQKWTTYIDANHAHLKAAQDLRDLRRRADAEHEKCECPERGTWGATGRMPPGHHWYWRDMARTSGYLAHGEAAADVPTVAMPVMEAGTGEPR